VPAEDQMNAESSARHYDAAENLLEEAESHREPDTRAAWCLELAKVHLALAQAASALDPRRPKRSLSPPASTTNADRHEPATPKIFTPTRVQLGPQPGTETTSDTPPTNARPRVGPARPEREPPQPAQDPTRPPDVAPEPQPGWRRVERRDDRLDPAYEPDPSILPGREEARRNRR
jgi:hypothetical protein